MSVLAWNVIAHPVRTRADRRLAAALAQIVLLRMDNAELRAQNWALRDEQAHWAGGFEAGRLVGFQEAMRTQQRALLDQVEQAQIEAGGLP